MDDITPEMARQELARRELQRRQAARGGQEEGGSSIPADLAGMAISGIEHPGEAALNRLKGLGQGVQNVATGYANLIPGVNIPKGHWAGDSPDARMMEHLTDIGSFFLPGGALGAAGKIPHIANALKKAAPFIEHVPGLNALLKIGKGAGEGAVASAAQSDKEGQGEAAKTGAEFGGGASLLSQLLGAKNPVVNAIARMVTGGAIGAGGDYLTGRGHPYTSAGTGAAAGLLLPKGANMLINRMPAGHEVLEHINPMEVTQRLQAANRLGTPIRPSEASGNPFVAGLEGRAAATGEAAAEQTRFDQKRLGEQKAAIDKLKSEISPGSQDASHAIRSAAQQHLAELKSLREKAASPHYKQAENLEIPQHELDSLLEIPRVKNTLHSILNDQDYVHELGGAQPTGKKMAAMVENRIDNLIKNAKSKPYNKGTIENLEYAKKNFRKDYEDPRVQSVLQDIYKNDPVFHATAMGINPRSVKVMDIVKKDIDQTAENMGSKLNAKGQNRYKAGLIANASKKLRETYDQYVEPYRKAREVFGQMSPEVTRAEESVLGRLANLKDTQLKTAAPMIFDPAQTNLRVLSKIKQGIMRRNPEAWNGIVRNEIERLTKQGAESGVNFYRKVLSNDNQFKQFQLALDHNPDALKSLEDMKMAWEHLIAPQKPGAAAFRSKEGLNQSRDWIKAIIDNLHDLTGAKRNVAAIKFINSPDWEKGFAKIAEIKDKEKRIAALGRMLVHLTTKTGAAMAVAKSQGSEE